MLKKIGSVPDNGKARALDEALLPRTVGKGREFGALPEFPLHFGQREAAILKEACPDVGGAGFERLIAGAVVERQSVSTAAVGDIDQKRTVAVFGAPGKDQRDLCRVFDQPARVPRSLVQIRNGLGRLQLADDTALPQQEFAGLENPKTLLRFDLQPGHLRGYGNRQADSKSKNRGGQGRGSQTGMRHGKTPDVRCAPPYTARLPAAIKLPPDRIGAMAAPHHHRLLLRLVDQRRLESAAGVWPSVGFAAPDSPRRNILGPWFARLKPKPGLSRHHEARHRPRCKCEG